VTAWDSFKEAVRDAADIVTVIGNDIALKKCGRTLKGCSPFTGEKNPSFHVWPEQGRWWDYSGGRNTGGDVFDYVIAREGLSFREALESLAERFNVPRPSSTPEEIEQRLAIEQERRELFRIHELAAAYYHRVLPDRWRTHYRDHYGFTDETIDTFQLGWGTGELWSYVTEVEKIARTAALKSGLFVRLKSGEVVDYFQQRLVFPYRRRGKVCYFTGRHTDDTPKAPWEDNSKYKKLLTRSDRHPYISEHIANDVFFNEDAVRGAELVIITEGTPDCISAAQAGFAAVSPCTTQVSERDIDRMVALAARARRVVICNDSELKGSGDRGALETATRMWAAGRPVYLATIPLPEGREKIDVNELVSEQGAEALERVIADATWWPEVLIERVPAQQHPDFRVRLDAALGAAAIGCEIDRERIVNDLVDRTRLGKRVLKDRLKSIPEAHSRSDQPGEGELSGARLPQIREFSVVVNGRQLRDVLVDATRILLARNARRLAEAAVKGAVDPSPIFQRSSQLVRLAEEEGVPVISAMNRDQVYGYLTRDAEWLFVREVEGETYYEDAYPEPRVAADLAALPPREIPRLTEVLATPVFGRSGQLLMTPGYHADDQVWMVQSPGLVVPPVPERPTSDQIAEARNLLLNDLFVDFPFVTQSDRAHALSALLSIFLRRMIPGCVPLHLVEAPEIGTGKSLISKLINIIVTGKSIEGKSLPGDEEEIRKQLTSLLLTGRPLLVLDNAKQQRNVDSSTLAALLTSTSWSDRILGRTEIVTVPNRAVWMLNGNNIEVSAEIARRCVRIRIDSGVDRPWLRSGFKHDPIEEWAIENRGRLVWAALTLCQAWIAAGCPEGTQRLGSFERWARGMGGCFDVISVEGLLANPHQMYVQVDERKQALEELVQFWATEFGERPVHTQDLLRLCRERELLIDLVGDHSEQSQMQRLGRLLTKNRDRVIAGYRLRRVDARANRKLYQLERDTGPALSQLAVSESADAVEEVDPWE